MDKSLLIGGFGGQGVQTMGKLLTYAANDAGLHVTFFPAYGGEMRGGTSNCTVVFSDKQIGSPSRRMVDYAVVLNIPSYNKFSQRVKPGGVLFVNSSLIKERPENPNFTVVEVPLNDLVTKIGNVKTLNIIMYGFFVAYTKVMPLDTALATLEERLGKKKEFAALNKQAFELGIAVAREQSQV